MTCYHGDARIMNSDFSSAPELLKQIECLKKENEALKALIKIDLKQAHPYIHGDNSQADVINVSFQQVLNEFMTNSREILGIDTIAAQEALRKSEETYRQMFQVNHAVKLLIDPDTADLIDANQAAAEFYGYPIEKLRGMKLFDINATQQDSIKRILADASADRVKSISTQHIDSQGLTHNVEVFISPLSLGEKTLLYAIVIDVTDKKAAERKLQETERILRDTNELLEQRVIERSAELSAINARLLCEVDDHCRTASSLKDSENNLKVMIDSAPIGITVIQDGKYRYVNEAFIKILGVDTKESAIGRIAGFFGGPTHEKGVQELLGRCIQNSEPLSMREFKVKLNDSKELNLNIWFQPLELWGQPSIIGFYVDVSEEMQLRSHLNQSQKMEALGALAGGIAHDFNNILFAITGFAELTLDSVKSIPKARSHIQQLLKASDRAADLIKHILTFSREAEQEKRPLWVSPILKESLNFLRASIPASIEIKRNIYQDCGIVNADPTQIHQIIMNLVTNAAHAMRDKGGVLEVDLEDVELSEDSLMSTPSMAPGVYQKLRISDTGHGIPNDLMSRIFDPYFTTKETGRGTGLGLSVVDGIVRSHKGFVKVESLVGVGSVFEVFLPVISEPAEQEQDETRVSSPGRGKILLVDDEKIVTTATKANLENLGYKVETDNNPVNALKKFKADPHSFDLIITDMSMPRMNGAELSQAILKIRNDIPIIMLSGFAELMNKEHALSLGLRDFLLKPIRRAVLAEAVSAAILNGKA